jgi:hypothetical protein
MNDVNDGIFSFFFSVHSSLSNEDQKRVGGTSVRLRYYRTPIHFQGMGREMDD